MADYTNIDRPYDSVGNRTPGGLSPVTNEPRGIFSMPAQASSDADPTAVGSASLDVNYLGPPEEVPTQIIDDLWISTFIRSKNWKPGARGFSIDGGTGNAEFNDVTVRGTIIARGGSIGGFTIEDNQLSSDGNYIILDGEDGEIRVYDSTGLRVFIGGVTGALDFYDGSGNRVGGYAGSAGTFTIDAVTNLNITVSGLLTETASTHLFNSGTNQFVNTIVPTVDTIPDIGTTVKRWGVAYLQAIAVNIYASPGTFPFVTGGGGAPNGVITAPQGSLWLRTDGGANTTLYVKESGSGSTGWVAK